MIVIKDLLKSVSYTLSSSSGTVAFTIQDAQIHLSTPTVPADIAHDNCQRLSSDVTEAADQSH
jgi:hypothetical protein